jgi:hypothetical protein
MMKKLIYTLAILAAFSVSCYYDSEEGLYPESILLASCDTVNVTYSGSIVSLLDNNCLSCHGSSVAASLGGNINLEGYANVSAFKDAALASIKQTSSKPMPKNTAKLKDCLIRQFEIWVSAGSPNN